MNLILFEPDEIERPLPRTDRRAVHLLEVLRRGVGESFDAGVINGPQGKATLVTVTPHTLELSFQATVQPSVIEPVTLIVGLPRPQTARDILRDATTLGVAAIHFVRTEKTEPSYAHSSLWTSGEWRRHLIIGAEQAFSTRIPAVTRHHKLEEALATLVSVPGLTRVALDNYEPALRLGELSAPIGSSVVLAIGGERGWGAGDREQLREHHFQFAHLGRRVLRTETAAIAALSILRTRLGLM